MDKVLVPVDFSSNSLNALEYALNLTETLGSKLYVVHVAKGGVLPNFLKNANELPKHNAKKQMHRLKDKVKADFNEVRAEFLIRKGSFIEEMNKLIEEIDVELIIMGTVVKRKELKTIFFGSNTIDVIEKVNYPLMGSSIGPHSQYKCLDI